MVVPVPDPKVYQEMCMCIVPALGDERPTEAAVKAYCQSLAVPGNSDCVPRCVHLTIVYLSLLSQLVISSTVATADT